MVTKKTKLIPQSKHKSESKPLAKQSTYKLESWGQPDVAPIQDYFSCYFQYDPLYKEYVILCDHFYALFNGI